MKSSEVESDLNTGSISWSHFFLAYLPFAILVAYGIILTLPHLFTPPRTGDDDNIVRSAITLMNFEKKGYFHLGGLSTWNPAPSPLKQEPGKVWQYISYPPLWNLVPYSIYKPLSLFWPKIVEPLNTIYFLRIYNLVVNRVLFLAVLYCFLILVIALCHRELPFCYSIFGALFVFAPAALEPRFLYMSQNTYFTDQSPFLPIVLLLLLYLLPKNWKNQSETLFGFSVAAASFFSFGMEWLGLISIGLLGAFDFLIHRGKVSSFLKWMVGGFSLSLLFYGWQILWYPPGLEQLFGRFLERSGPNVEFFQVSYRLTKLFSEFFNGKALAQFFLFLLVPASLCILIFRKKLFPLAIVILVLVLSPLIHAALLRELFVTFKFAWVKLELVFVGTLICVPVLVSFSKVSQRIKYLIMVFLTIGSLGLATHNLKTRYRAIVAGDILMPLQTELMATGKAVKEKFPTENLFLSDTLQIAAHSLLGAFYLNNYVFDAELFYWLYENNQFDTEKVGPHSDAIFLWQGRNQKGAQCAKEVCDSGPYEVVRGRNVCRLKVSAFLKGKTCREIQLHAGRENTKGR